MERQSSPGGLEGDAIVGSTVSLAALPRPLTPRALPDPIDSPSPTFVGGRACLRACGVLAVRDEWPG